jgi:hypothetical protein
MSIEKTFNPDYEYSFWFHKPKFEWIMEMFDLVMDYKFSDGEVEGMLISLANTNNEDKSKWNGGLHYGNKGTMYINMALDAEDKDMVHISISSTVKFQPQIEFIDLLQCTYEGFHKYRTY